MIKICILVSNSLRKDPRVIKQIQCALDEGFEVDFIGLRDSNYSKPFLENIGCNIRMIDLGDSYVGHLKSVFKKIYRKWMQFYLPIKWITKIQPEVIHANDFDTLVQSFIASKLCQAKVLYDSHEICAENIGVANNEMHKRIIIFIERLLVGRVGAMVSVSNAASQYFSDTYNIPKPVVITNCPYRDDSSILTHKKNEGFEALYQGLMLKGRGYEEFVQSAKYLNDKIKLVLRGYGSIANDLKKIIADNNLDDKVRFDDPVEIMDIVQKASESNLGVVLTQPVNINFKYTVSNKIFEYIQAGLPVLMSDIPEHRFLNEQFKFGIIITDFSLENIAKCINEIASDQEKYNLLRKNAIEAAKLLCWENESRKLIFLYRKLASKNSTFKTDKENH